MEYTCSTTPKTQIPTDLRFEGKTIVITGAGGQFGRAGCLYFCQRGARVAALDNSIEALQATYEALGSLGDIDFCGYACNVTDATAVTTVVDQVVARFQKIDLLWNVSSIVAATISFE
jgi:NAD(P)-dependent dehydrogenase (short-subunit alcohol dehydrogenase family)